MADAERPARAVRVHHRGFAGVGEVFLVFLMLGLTSFGGPIAHLGYFRHEFVVHRQWFGDEVYADLVALCQFPPGPASSKVGIGSGSPAGLPGALAAWIGFTTPSAFALFAFRIWCGAFAVPQRVGHGPWIEGRCGRRGRAGRMGDGEESRARIAKRASLACPPPCWSWPDRHWSDCSDRHRGA